MATRQEMPEHVGQVEMDRDVRSIQDEPITRPGDFLRRLPAKEGGTIMVSVETMTGEHVRCWHTHVQPSIDTSRERRADKGWRWSRIRGLAATVGVMQKPAAYAVCLGGVPLIGSLPCAMVALAESYRALEAPKKSVFLWYMATAPENTLESLLGGLRVPKAAGQAALDVARARAFSLGHRGRVGLHADEGGGQKLFGWYEQQGMLSLSREVKIRSPFRQNDGRYFYYTPEGAAEAHQKLQWLRRI